MSVGVFLIGYLLGIIASCVVRVFMEKEAVDKGYINLDGKDYLLTSKNER